MLNINYIVSNFAIVQSLPDLYKERLAEIPHIRSIHDNIRLLFGIPSNKIQVLIAEGERIYKFICFNGKLPFCWFVYLPLEHRLDLYDATSPDIPLIQWKNRKVVFSNYSKLLILSNFDRLYSRIVTSC